MSFLRTASLSDSRWSRISDGKASSYLSGACLSRGFGLSAGAEVAGSMCDFVVFVIFRVQFACGRGFTHSSRRSVMHAAVYERRCSGLQPRAPSASAPHAARRTRRRQWPASATATAIDACHASACAPGRRPYGWSGCQPEAGRAPSYGAVPDGGEGPRGPGGTPSRAPHSRPRRAAPEDGAL